MSSQWVEKTVIFVSLLAAFPLFFLDKAMLGYRRFAWLVAMCTGLASHIFLDPTDPTSELLDKVTMAAISVTSVPHLLQLIKDSPWFGFATIPPIFVVVHLSISTTVNSEAYWRLRAFLHMAVFILPYLNHLPEEPKKEGDGEEMTEAEKDNIKSESKETVSTKSSSSSPTKASSTGGKTAKHKSGGKNKKKNY